MAGGFYGAGLWKFGDGDGEVRVWLGWVRWVVGG